MHTYLDVTVASDSMGGKVLGVTNSPLVEKVTEKQSFDFIVNYLRRTRHRTFYLLCLLFLPTIQQKHVTFS